MSLEQMCPPIDPIQFRDDVAEMLEEAKARNLLGEKLSLLEFSSIWLLGKYVKPGANTPDHIREYCFNAAMRHSQLVRVLKTRRDPEVVRESEGLMEVHAALVEAAAVVPFAETEEFGKSLRKEALERKVEIEALNALLPE